MYQHNGGDIMASYLTLHDTRRILGVTKENIILSEEIYKPIDRLTLAIIANGPITQKSLDSIYNIFWSKQTLKDSLKRLEERYYIYKKSINGNNVWYYGIALIRQLNKKEINAKVQKPEISENTFTEIEMRSKLFASALYNHLKVNGIDKIKITDRKEQIEIVGNAITIYASGFCLRCWNGVLYYLYKDNNKIAELRRYDTNRRKILELSGFLYCSRTRDNTQNKEEAQNEIESLQKFNESLKPIVSYSDIYNNYRPFTFDVLRERNIYIERIDFERGVLYASVLDSSSSGFSKTNLYDKLATLFFLCIYLEETKPFRPIITIYTTNGTRLKKLLKDVNDIKEKDRSDKRPRLNSIIHNSKISVSLPPLLK